jgi:putative endonuclease
VDISRQTRKDIGRLGESVAAEYLRRRGYTLVDRNVARKTGELDLVAREGGVLHIVEVKTITVDAFPDRDRTADAYDDPALNLHAAKVRKVSRTGEWYVLEKHWEGEWQVDGCLVWVRRSDGRCLVRYVPQIV